MPDIPRILEDVLLDELPDVYARIPVLAGVTASVVVGDDLPTLTEASYPVVVLRDADQVDEVVVDATQSARTYEQSIAVGAFDPSETVLGSEIVRAVVVAVRAVLLGYPSLPVGLRILEVANPDYGRTGSVGEVGPNGIAVAEFTARLWSVEPTVLPIAPPEPTVIHAEVTVTPVPANQE